MDNAKQRVASRAKRAARVKKKLFGSVERPRLCVRRTLRNVIAQIIDDVNGVTLVYVDSSNKLIADKSVGLTKTEVSKLVGEAVAAKAKEKGITSVVFDRKGYPYHGRVKALADAARENGLQF